MQKFTSWAKKNWGIFVLLAVELAIIFTNFKPGTYLMGWDNVMPELNFRANLVRNLWGVWQEHRGLGLYDGMSHIALTIHTLFLWSVSLVLPQNLLRYFFQFLMHFLGCAGIYVLLMHLKQDDKHVRLISLAGGLFYQLNLATIQMFYTPLEVFSVHFAALPWLALTLIAYLKQGSKRTLGLFLLVSLLTTPQYFVTTLFLTTLILILSLILTYSFSGLKQKQGRWFFKRSAIALGGFILVNLFWLLPYIYGLPHNAPVIAQAKINQMSSQEIFVRNQAFGDIVNVFLLRGFSLDYVDLNQNNKPQLLMQPWRNYINQPLVLILSITLGLISVWGLIKCLVQKSKTQNSLSWPLSAFGLTFLMGFWMLGTNIPLLRESVGYLRSHIPFFAEIFRFSFTKGSLLFAFSYSIFLALGMTELLHAFSKSRAIQRVFLAGFIFLSIVIVSLPVFTGHLFYANLRIKLPPAYPALFKYMGQLDPASRVAILPQPEYWSWKHYSFGYRGSGFLWYGLNQPLLDRAFDPWSQQNENYFWELSYAIYAKDALKFANVSAKYDVGYLILDENLLSTGNNRSLFIDETKTLLSQVPAIKRIAQFDKLTIYERVGLTSNSFVQVGQNLPSVSPPYSWTDFDLAYQELGNYQTAQSALDYIYQYRSLFTKRAVSQREFHVTETPDQLILSPVAQGQQIALPRSTTLVYTSDSVPDLNPAKVTQCDLFRNGTTEAKTKSDQQTAYLEFTATNQRSCLSFNIPQLEHRNGFLVAVTSKHVSGRPLLISLINQTAKHVELETLLPETPTWETSYLILPPLTSDGLGYNVYLLNDAIGDIPSINDISRIQVYKFPYPELTHLKSSPSNNPIETQVSKTISVLHPNPAEYWVEIPGKNKDKTLILNQSYNAGWVAFAKTQEFPYFQRLKDHVLVNNWANAWFLEEEPKSADQAPFDPSTNSSEKDQSKLRRRWNESLTIYIFFWPQILEFIGFALLPLPFLWILLKKS
ncbi:MAG: hypothetical protein UV61_C0019G0038 [Candidatus Gottesmanbacteria bacterium GW2011_GWB1_43_11]|uniref:Membrane protein 6-pyruvoyl-tetrahydropterin synthase-related domain-containing protein n=1 Tax=Candidatus Gottesmanbacteria bacterium GW2011_GWB1_43_11 TaxID=1618446 RepID=A0A0G1CIG8_9BACT|nr:MAG: hypothetical protein UV04_C0027G0007 [Candidatus Gottesmanbacteria bacterium GW2011_GWA2_42_16]KKS54430.1 MAG: hypothetical protein UV17_C0019G0027 [Candidatus Gottesmanbacteria bacterium GW2011_GWA1_42_26]KKS80156.1 MAG: hypothetical protein UV55_C0047G0006 [Candidatus Gottesmanbacteria bacterium GW2011_GWC1_43_10]KKS85274.1 MAG: hypothetical protein UV61_C0019G0038 [Candidatus Gottesmanbacteria bacterium GW2011_GWB1_43_11]OGG10659.1 MAG: hypothetical protein A2699_02540 [Candidatus Go